MQIPIPMPTYSVNGTIFYNLVEIISEDKLSDNMIPLVWFIHVM